ncbi:MAG: PAS domain S-box protein [Methylobacillus sp.]|jgi:PAS domain S-box-containing protein|nr:PAS domain S-box protein [Methylobacillus sp.]
MSLRFRLNLLVTALLLLFMAAMGVALVKETRISIREGVESATHVTTQMLDRVIVSAFMNPELGSTSDVLQQFLESLGRVRSTDIYLYDMQDRLIYQSPQSTFKTDESPPQWFVALVAPEQEVVERPIRGGVMRVVSNPSGAIREAWGGVEMRLWISGALFFMLNLGVYWTLGRALRPVGKILGAIDRMEQGDLTARLEELSLPEINQIGQSFNRMAESLETRTEENRRLALIVQQTNDAIMIHDTDGNISFWNPAAERLFGYSPQDIIGHSAAVLIPKGQAAEAVAARRVIESYDTRRITRDGRVVDVSLSVAPLVNPHDGRVIGEICSMRDITERKQAEEAERKLEENRQLTHLIQRHIEEERRNLARELHDELGQYVTAIKTFAVAIANKTREPMPEVAASAATIVAAAEHIYDDMHNIIRQLRPGALDNLGLTETLRDAVANWQRQHPDMRFTLDFSGELEHLNESLAINLYRIVQEAVTNAARHSGASQIAITLARDERGALGLTIADNGRGMNPRAVDQSRHFGLLGMKERVQSLRGQFELDSQPDGGTRIRVHIPEQEQA